jgi:MazG family protein
MEKLLETMRRLRAPDGCPWDREQTHESLRPYLLEEAAEAVDALGTADPKVMADELGDVLLQVAFHAVVAEEAGTFGYPEIETSIVEKLVRRHPHVFGDTDVADAAEVKRNWQRIKTEERGGVEPTPAERVPRSLPALMRAAELGKKLGWAGGKQESIVQALTASQTMPDEQSIGELLLAVVDYARAEGINPELALRRAADARAGL